MLHPGQVQAYPQTGVSHYPYNILILKQKMRPRILFVDDEPRVLSGLKRSLRSHMGTWDMQFVQSSKAAIEEYRAQPFDVVVSDLAMPEPNGLTMIMEMRKLGTPTAFIMLTGTADLSKAVDAINRAEVFRFFTKPCGTGLLVEGIEAALRESHVAEQTIAQNVEGGRGLRSITDAIGLAALNRLAVGALVVDSDSRILLANQAAGQILSSADGLMIAQDNICRAGIPTETQRLHALVRAAAVKTGASVEDAGGMAISRTAMKRPLGVLVLPLAEVSSVTENEDECFAVIFVTDPERQPLPSSETIGKMFGLSPAEARLAHALAEGLRVEEAAERCGVTVSTARTYLKQAFAKTETNRQSELVKLILTSPALI